MNELIHIYNQGSELRADSREVSKLFGITHKHLRETIESHEDQLSQLGVLRFETAKPLKAGWFGGRPEKFCFLNFDQIAFLLTLTRTTAQTKEFRLRLIVAFRDARNRLRPIDHALLSIPDAWRKTFPDDFYVALLNLYGDKFEKSGDTPSWVGRWTNRFIYEPLYNGLPDELKRRRNERGEAVGADAWLKLHQFIEEHAKKNLEKHLAKVTALLQAATSRAHFIELFGAVFYGQQQLLLLPPDVRDEFS
jgi:P63C domain/Phage regulatory protein Rha (Phage_pRha)